VKAREVAGITQDKPNHRVCVSCIEPSNSVISINLIINVQEVNFELTYLAAIGTQINKSAEILQVNSSGKQGLEGVLRSGVLQGSSSDLSPQSSSPLQRRCLSMQRPLLQENAPDAQVTGAEIIILI
jgi:hypothetical protein